MNIQAQNVNIYTQQTAFTSCPRLKPETRRFKNTFSGTKTNTGKNIISNFAQKTIARGILKFYQFLDGYDKTATQDLEKMFSCSDISFKQLLLYIHSGALHFRELRNVQDINEINKDERKNLLKKFIKDDISCFTLNRYVFPGISDILPLKFYPKSIEDRLYQEFPLLPKNEEGYSIFLEKLVDSLGVKTESLSKEKTDKFNTSLSSLTAKLTKISDEEFINKDFSNIEEIKTILDCLPELKSTIGRKQHGTHEFDVFKHSLKVLKKIGEDSNFKKLNHSDKKVLMLAALMHDITKKEGVIDESHPFDSSFEAFYITKRLNLTEEEESKLYKIIKNHEWLKYVNTHSKDKRNYRLNNIAWEFLNDNILDMSLIFTHADLKSVKKDDSFHNFINGKGNVKLNGKVRSYGESADIYAETIRAKIIELQKSQPLAPLTRFPKASRIKEAIRIVNSDGSTNIKGVYIDNSGLVILKFNEIEEWEKIGFPTGSTTKGIRVPSGTNNKDVETGNIKFLAHGLAYPNQLARFCAFNLPDSTALLSVSYAERPETKYRFFRPQGLLGYTDTFNIIGGGVSDSGSGFKKNLKKFRYLLDNDAKKHRVFLANLIKKATGMNDEQYRDFVITNKNKPFCEIYPENTRNVIIKTLAMMKSSTRRLSREYNEFYASNFKPMATFAYNVGKSDIGNPVEFLNRTEFTKEEDTPRSNWGLKKSVSERTNYLKKYALQNDFPFVVFGN